jgi:predicted dehydrogenase
MSRRIRIGVWGAGHLGRIHVQQLKELDMFDVVGVFDPHTEKCMALESEFGVRVYDSSAALMSAVEAVDVVTPTLMHHALAKGALEQRKHVFIEKPITNTLQEAHELIALADANGLKAQVGHVERFNPSFQAARPFLTEPMFIESHRLAQFNPRGTDVSVVLDLMIHDIDLVLSVVDAPISNIVASGVAVVSDTPDITNARIAFANGCVANLTASRISLKNMRKSRFFQRDAYISVDMLTKETEIVRMRTVEGDPDPFSVTIELGNGKGSREISFEKPEVPKTNAIREELRSFAASIVGHSPVVVPLRDGAAALETAHRVLQAMEIQKA